MPPTLMDSTRMPVQVRPQSPTNTPTNSSRSNSTHSYRRTRDRRQRRHGSGARGPPAPEPYVREDVLCRFCGQFHEKSGPHLYDYAGDVDDDFNCHICLQPLVNPVDTICSHTFCFPCLKSHLRFQKACPIDRNALTLNDVRPASILVNKLLDKLIVICPNTEYCQEQCQRCELEAHLANRCPGAPSICARANLGCLFSGPRALLQKHVDECLFYQNLSSKEVSSRVDEGVVSVIEIDFEGGSYELGMTLIGGVDTPLIYVMIQEIFPTGAIAKDGRLRVNDQILDVNGTDLTVLTHRDCVGLILKTTETQNKLRIAVYREATEETGKIAFGEEVIKVSLDKTIQQFLGLKLTTKKFHGIAGLYVEELVEAGVACADGRLQPEDRILEINGQSVRDAPQEMAVQLIQNCDSVEFVVSRFPNSSLSEGASSSVDSASSPSGLPSPGEDNPGSLSPSSSATPQPPCSFTEKQETTHSNAVPLPVVTEHVALSFSRSVSYPCAQFETFNQGGNGVSSFLKSTAPPSSSSASLSPPPMPASAAEMSEDLPMRQTVETVIHVVKRVGESLGISVAGGKATNHAVVSPSSSSARTRSDRGGGNRPQTSDEGDEDYGPDVQGGESRPVRSHDIPVYVTKISTGGCMEKHGGVSKGDIITIVNGVSLFGLSHSEAVKVLKSCISSASVSLHIIDGQQTKRTADCDATASFVPTWDYWLHLPPHVQPLKTITIRRSDTGSLGFSIVGGVDSGCLLSQAIFVKSILPGSPASLDGRLRCGDVIVAVDDSHVTRVNHAQAVQLLKKGKSHNVVLIVVSWPGSIV